MTDANTPGTLPPGWTMQRLDEACTVVPGTSPKSETFSDDLAVGTPFLQGNAEFGDRSPTPRKSTTNPLRVAPAGAVLVSVRAPVGDTNIAAKDVAIGRGLAALIPRDGLSPDYLFWVLRARRYTLEHQGTGTTFAGVTSAVLRALPIPVPPLAEQVQIVELVTDAVAASGTAAVGLSGAARKAKQLRVAARHAAFDADEERISLSAVASIQSGVTKSAAKEIGDTPVPYLSTANVQAGRLELGTVKTIAASPSQREKHRLRHGDVLVLEGGDPDKVGRGWLWNDEIDECLHQNHVFAVRVDQSRVEPRYLAHFINAPQARAFFLSQAKQTTGIASINKRQLRDTLIPLPNTAEQRRVVDRLEQQLSLADALDEQLAVATATARALEQSVLRDALAGRLTAASAS